MISSTPENAKSQVDFFIASFDRYVLHMISLKAQHQSWFVEHITTPDIERIPEDLPHSLMDGAWDRASMKARCRGIMYCRTLSRKACSPVVIHIDTDMVT